MPPLDSTTIAALSSLVNLVVVILLLHAGMTSQTYSGFRFWLAGSLCWTIGSLLTLVFRYQLPEFVPILIGNGLVLLNPLLFYEGFVRYYQIKRHWWGTPLNLVLLIAALILQAAFLYLVDDYNARTANLTLVLAILFGRIAVEPLLIARSRRSVQWLLSLSLVPLILLLLQRGFQHLSDAIGTGTAQQVLQDPSLRHILLWSLIVQFMLVYTYLSLNSSRTEHELKLSQEKFRMLTEGAADLVLQLDRDLLISYVNSICKKTLGYTVDEMTGQTVYEFVAEPDREIVRQANRKRLQQEQQGQVTGAIRYELQLLHKNGSHIWCEILANPIRDEGGSINAYIAIVRDISILKHDQQRLAAVLETAQRTNLEQELFLDMIAHEYRTPLAIMQTSIDIIDKKFTAEQHGLSGYLDKIQRAIDRLLELFEATKRRKGIGHRQKHPVLQQVNLDLFFRDSVLTATEFWGQRFEARNLLPTGMVLKIDQHLLRTALLNLLDNAIKFSIPDTMITLHFTQQQQHLQIMVVNQSTGAFDSDPQQLFSKFWRGANSTGTSGSGVGLFLVNSIAQQFGGSLKVHLDQANQVTVVLLLPFSTDAEETDVA